MQFNTVHLGVRKLGLWFHIHVIYAKESVRFVEEANIKQKLRQLNFTIGGISIVSKQLKRIHYWLSKIPLKSALVAIKLLIGFGMPQQEQDQRMSIESSIQLRKCQSGCECDLPKYASYGWRN